MGQVRDAECENIDKELRALFPGCETDCRLDTYTLDYIIYRDQHIGLKFRLVFMLFRVSQQQ